MSRTGVAVAVVARAREMLCELSNVGEENSAVEAVQRLTAYLPGSLLDGRLNSIRGRAYVALSSS
jgi:hypothetical protein